MKKIDKYIFFSFLKVFIYGTVFSLFLFDITDFFSNISSILSSKIGIVGIIEYYFYYAPLILYWSLPLIFTISTLLVLGVMSLKNEIIVLRSSGVNILKITYPIFIFSFIISIAIFSLGEFVVNKTINKAMFIKRFEVDNSRKPIWIKKNNYFIKMYISNINTLNVKDITIYKIENNKIVRVIYAKDGRFGNKNLFLKDVEYIQTYPKVKKSFLRKLLINIKIVPNDLFENVGVINTPTIKQLVNGLKRYKSHAYYYEAYITLKILYPLSCMILTLLSLTFILRITSRKSGFIKNVFLGSLLSIIYIGSLIVLNTMGRVGMLPPVMPLLFFITFFTLYSIYNILKQGF